MDVQTKYRQKLIEVALPLDAINKASSREKSIRHGHPSTLHLWWARRPLAAARAVIFAQMVDDPSSHPELFPTVEEQERERNRLFMIIEELVKWENTTNERVLSAAREEIWKSWRSTCDDNKDHPLAEEIFNSEKLPAFHDPFAGGGTLPLEAQRLGLESYASDLNPVAVLINKAMIEIPPKFAGMHPINPESQNNNNFFDKKWSGVEGIVEDLTYYGQWMHSEAEKRIGKFYPKIEITPQITKDRPDLLWLQGQKLTIIAWIWARTVASPNPAFREVNVPLASTFILSNNLGNEAFIEPVIQSSAYWFKVKIGKPENIASVKAGTKLGSGANFKCLMSGTPISGDYIRAEGRKGKMGERLMAIVVDGPTGRIYLPPLEEHESLAKEVNPNWSPEIEFFKKALGFRVGNYGMTKWSDIFSKRQLLVLSTFSELVGEVIKLIELDAINANLSNDTIKLRSGGLGALSYAESLGVYLAFTVSKMANRANTIATWMPDVQCPGHLFRRHAIPMSWDYSEGNSLSGPSGSFLSMLDGTLKGLTNVVVESEKSHGMQADAATQTISYNKVVSTDPPYYDNLGYADLSDFFYVWLRYSLGAVFPDLFATVVTPKDDELVATPDRHGGKQNAEMYYLNGMTRAINRLSDQAHPAFPVTIYYAFKQAEGKVEANLFSTGWETFLAAVISSGFIITGTWPIRTERENRSRNQNSNALASSIVLVCQRRGIKSITTTRGDFIKTLKRELPNALNILRSSNIAPVDLAQAAIGPGMSVFTRYSAVIDSKGKPIPVKDALSLINQTVDEVFAEQEGEFDADTRWALTWFEQKGFNEGEFGVAETLSKAKNTSVEGLVFAGIATSKGGKVKLIAPKDLSSNWDPLKDNRLTEWEIVHHLIRSLENNGETGAADLVANIGSRAEIARDLAYRLYMICERKKRSQEAISYNSLVQSWPEIMRITQQQVKEIPIQKGLFDQE